MQIKSKECKQNNASSRPVIIASRLRMAKKHVSKYTYYTATIIYHALCLAGLVWQVTQISMNFFKFDVIKDINVLMPEEVKNSNLQMNICFKNYEILQYDYYIRYIVEQQFGETARRNADSKFTKRKVVASMTLDERFAITMEKRTMIHRDQGIEFIFDSNFCFQVNASLVRIERKDIANVTDIGFSKGEPIPHFDPLRLIFMSDLRSPNETILIELRSYLYDIHKLPWPYVDNCIDYQKINNKPNRFIAIADCVNEKTITRRDGLSKSKIFLKGDGYGNYSIAIASRDIIEDLSIDCKAEHSNFDCNQRVYLTEARVTEYTHYRSPIMFVSMANDKDPSFKIISKARIDDIDYFTYIFGALGTWLGFSFIAVDPVPFFLEMTKLSPTNTIDTATNDSAISQLRVDVSLSAQKMALVELEATRAKEERNAFRKSYQSLKREVMADRQKMALLVQEINQIKRSRLFQH